MKFVINACNFAAILHRKLGLVFRGFEGALEQLLQFLKNTLTLYPITKMGKIQPGWF